MDTFFGHTLVNVSNSLGPHCECIHLLSGLGQPGHMPEITVWCAFQSALTCRLSIYLDIGGGLNHGIEIQNGPHKGRLVLALRFDTACAHSPDYMRAYALFSDE